MDIHIDRSIHGVALKSSLYAYTEIRRRIHIAEHPTLEDLHSGLYITWIHAFTKKRVKRHVILELNNDASEKINFVFDASSGRLRRGEVSFFHP